MPSIDLSEQQVTDVLNYIFYSWENDVEELATMEEVRSIGKNN